MRSLSSIGRILFALPFGVIGINHFVLTDAFTGMMTSFVPGSGYSVLLTGFALVAASISIILKKYIRICCLTLAVLLFLFISTIHVPGLFSEETYFVSMLNLLKDTSLLGGALMIAGIYKPGEKEPSLL